MEGSRSWPVETCDWSGETPCRGWNLGPQEGYWVHEIVSEFRCGETPPPTHPGRRFALVKKAVLLFLGAVLLTAACSSPTMPRLPRDPDPNKPAGSDSTSTGFVLPSEGISFLA